jgi:hypothetical protein
VKSTELANDPEFPKGVSEIEISIDLMSLIKPLSFRCLRLQLLTPRTASFFGSHRIKKLKYAVTLTG